MTESALKNVLVIGSGGREHAICWKLAQSRHIQQVFCLPGSPGISMTPKTLCVTDVKANDFKVGQYSDHTLLQLVRTYMPNITAAALFVNLLFATCVKTGHRSVVCL